MIATFAIGNSDDKLPQADWSVFVGAVHAAVDQAVLHGAHIHFAGYSAPGAPWQNALWAIELPDHDLSVRHRLRTELCSLAFIYRQNWIAWWESDTTEMLEPVR